MNLSKIIEIIFIFLSATALVLGILMVLFSPNVFLLILGFVLCALGALGLLIELEGGEL